MSFHRFLLSSCLLSVLLLSLPLASIGARSSSCIKLDNTLSYTQETAPSDVNDMINIITNFLNREVRGVLRVDVNYTGDNIHGMVGDQTITTQVKRRSGNSQIVECYDISFFIADIDECTYRGSVERLRHNCHSTSVCRNTVGSYQCECPAGYYGKEGSGVITEEVFRSFSGSTVQTKGGKCGGHSSTERCCGEDDLSCDKSLCVRKCKADFKCTNDPCESTICGTNAICVPSGGKKAKCECQTGFIGDPYVSCTMKEKVDYCQNSNCPCNCLCESMDELNGYMCFAKEGYVSVENSVLGLPLPRDYHSRGGKRLDSASCVDASLPELHLNPPNPLILQQGDVYQEYGITVVDKNDEEFRRQIDFQYSKPFGEYMTDIGVEHVTYTLKTPWLPTPQLSILRDVIVVDVDECHYTGPIKQFQHKCHLELANCYNTEGSYYCECKPGYVGDGYTTGSGCRDGNAPVISCRGSGCEVKKFQACDCRGLIGPDGRPLKLDDTLTIDFIESQLKTVTSFCEPHEEPCFVAYDETSYGREDLTTQIRRGPIERMSSRKPGVWEFSVAYTVQDKAGNRAEPVYQMIEVEKIQNFDSNAGSGSCRRW